MGALPVGCCETPSWWVVAEALPTVLKAMPLLDEREMSYRYVGAHHPRATPAWLDERWRQIVLPGRRVLE